MQENPQNPTNLTNAPVEPNVNPINPLPQNQIPRKKSPFKIVGLGCGGLFLLLIALALLSPDAPKTKPTNTKPTNTAATSKSKISTTNDLTPYFGTWEGQDGTKISIRGDGKGDFNGGNFKVEGGGMTLDNAAKTLKISSFFGIGREWKIEQAPKNVDGNGEMKLNGVVYRRVGGFDPSNATSSTRINNQTPFDADKVPSRNEQVRLTRQTLLDFDRSVVAADFTQFHATISEMWQSEISAQELTKAFQPFIRQKIRIAGTANTLSPTFSPAPKIDNSVLTLQGFYPSKPSRLTFRLKFVPEGDAWKLFGIRVNVVPQ